MKLERLSMHDANGTSLQGYVDVGYDTLVSLFGEPDPGDEYKVDAEWVVDTPAGVATIYNYKTGVNYCGAEGIPVTKIRDWHVGGHSAGVVIHVQEAVRFADLDEVSA